MTSSQSNPLTRLRCGVLPIRDSTPASTYDSAYNPGNGQPLYAVVPPQRLSAPLSPRR